MNNPVVVLVDNQSHILSLSELGTDVDVALFPISVQIGFNGFGRSSLDYKITHMGDGECQCLGILSVP